ncbi:MAG: tetratricopeptide repeat protein [Brucellaceae bacterium]|nr:tetratricopeptide repeat protein [Brucellaceae bacterium]
MHRSNEATGTIRNLALAVAIASLTGLLSQPALAAGGDGGSGGTASTPKPVCPKGKVWSASKKKCVEARSEVVPDEELADYAFALAKADRYGEALDVLDMMRDPNTPKALNYRGYVTRHLGRVDEGITYYLKSVALDPDYPQVREYLGEAYVIKGRIDLAREQLEAIEAICGTDCEYYEDLSEAIDNPSGI